MKYELEVKECIEKGIGVISSHYCYNKERLDAFSEIVKKNGYDHNETIDAFLNCLSLESEQMFFNPAMAVLDILRTPACKKRLIETIYKYNGLVCELLIFFRDFKMEAEYNEVSTILIENRAQYYRSFESFMFFDREKGVEQYYKCLKAYPDANFFENVEKNYSLAYGYSVAGEFLKACIKHILGNPIDTKAEEKFWNDNMQNMIKLLPKKDFTSFLSKRYMLLIPNLQFMNRDVQEMVVRRLGTRKPAKIFKEGYTRIIAYYIIGRILNGETDVATLMNMLKTQERLVDWKDLLKILNLAYEDVDSYRVEWKEPLKVACELAEEHYQNECLDFLTYLLMCEE